MKKCKACQKEVDPKATKCPHCQTDLRNWFVRHPIITFLLILIIISIVGSSGSNKPSNLKTNLNSNTSNTKEVKTKKEATKNTPVPQISPEYKAALNKADTYANFMHMSKKAVYDQLISPYGEKFNQEAAQYAIDNVKADWKKNALIKAKTYLKDMNMSPAAIRDQLVSPYGEKFTEEEADYAIQHLND